MRAHKGSNYHKPHLLSQDKYRECRRSNIIGHNRKTLGILFLKANQMNAQPWIRGFVCFISAFTPLYFISTLCEKDLIDFRSQIFWWMSIQNKHIIMMRPHLIYSWPLNGCSLWGVHVDKFRERGHRWRWTRGHIQHPHNRLLFSWWNVGGGLKSGSLQRRTGQSGEKVPRENTGDTESLIENSNIANRCTVATMSARRRINWQLLITGSKSSANPSVFIYRGLATHISPGWNRHRLRASET